MRTLSPVWKFFRPPGASDFRRADLPAWQIGAYSLAIIAALYAGMVMERRLDWTRYTEVLGVIPVLLCSLFFLRIPPASPPNIRPAWRVLLLLLPFLPLFFASYAFPALNRDELAAWTFIAIQSLAIGVTEELVFRFGLYRLWSQYGATFYVAGSALLFGVLHYPLGLQVSVIATIIGLAFGLSRVAGMPLAVLILLHAFYDGPGISRSLGVQ